MIYGVVFVDKDNRSRSVALLQIETARREHHFKGVIAEDSLKGLKIERHAVWPITLMSAVPAQRPLKPDGSM